MSAEVIPITVLRPHRKPLDLVQVHAVVGGALAITVTDSEGDPVEVVMAPAEARRFLLEVSDALDMAEHLARDAKEAERRG